MGRIKSFIYNLLNHVGFIALAYNFWSSHFAAILIRDGYEAFHIAQERIRYGFRPKTSEERNQDWDRNAGHRMAEDNAFYWALNNPNLIFGFFMIMLVYLNLFIQKLLKPILNKLQPIDPAEKVVETERGQGIQLPDAMPSVLFQEPKMTSSTPASNHDSEKPRKRSSSNASHAGVSSPGKKM